MNGCIMTLKNNYICLLLFIGWLKSSPEISVLPCRKRQPLYTKATDSRGILDMTEAEQKRIEAFLSKAPCKWAKSYADRAPHWYILVSACPGELTEEFYWFVQAIKDFGYQEKFWSKTFTYLNVGEYKYWSMEQPHEKAILINKAKI